MSDSSNTSQTPKKRGRPKGVPNSGKMGVVKPPNAQKAKPAPRKGKRVGAREWKTWDVMEPVLKRAIARGEPPVKTAFFVQTQIKKSIDEGKPLLASAYVWSDTRIVAECEEICHSLGLAPWTQAAKTGVSLQLLIDRAQEVVAREGDNISPRDLASLAKTIMDLEAALGALRAGIVAPVSSADDAKSLLDQLFPEEEE